MQPSENNWNMVSEIELVYRSKIKATQRPLLRSSNDVFEFLASEITTSIRELVGALNRILAFSKTNTK